MFTIKYGSITASFSGPPATFYSHPSGYDTIIFK